METKFVLKAFTNTSKALVAEYISISCSFSWGGRASIALKQFLASGLFCVMKPSTKLSQGCRVFIIVLLFCLYYVGLKIDCPLDLLWNNNILYCIAKCKVMLCLNILHTFFGPTSKWIFSFFSKTPFIHFDIGLV